MRGYVCRRCEMGPLSQIQVGEYIIAHGGSEGNFALHMDAASSEGRELSAFVLGHRPIVEAGEPSVVNNLLLDLKWAMDKTSATRAKDFQGICKSVAELCKKVRVSPFPFSVSKALFGIERRIHFLNTCVCIIGRFGAYGTDCRAMPVCHYDR